MNSVGEGPAEPGRSATTWSPPRPPVDLEVTRGGDGELKLAWEPSPDAGAPAAMVEHRVQVARSPGGPAELVDEVESIYTRFYDTRRLPLQDYHYEVRAWNPAGEGVPSARACIVLPFETPVVNCR